MPVDNKLPVNGDPEPLPSEEYVWWKPRSWYLELYGKRTEVQLLKVMDPPIIFDYMYKLKNADPTTPREPFELRDDVFWMLVALFEKPKHLQKEMETEQFLTKIGYW
jgi:hypothetical protein